MPSLAEMVRYADEALRLAEIEDYPNALNGLQIENSGEVTKIGAAVDASGHTMQMAVEREIDLLVVHHGLFWPGLQRGHRAALSRVEAGAGAQSRALQRASAARFAPEDRQQRRSWPPRLVSRRRSRFSK